MSDRNYWGRTLVSRRAALRGAGLGIAGLAGAALVGCGADDPEPSPAATPPPATTPAPGAAPAATPTPEDIAGVLAPRTDTSAQAVAGGVFKSFRTADVPSLDPLSTTTFTTATISRWVYPQLVQYKPGIGDPATGDVEPYLSSEWEFVEPTRLIMKIRNDAKWDADAPTSSRPVDAEDVAWSWAKFEEQSIGRQALANKQNPEVAPILSMEAIDSNTLEVRTAFPYAPLLGSLAYSRWFQVMPRESESDFDPRNEMRGAGPWRMTRYDPSVRFEFRKNPNWWRQDRPFLDGFDLPIIAEYATRLAQFRAKQIWGPTVASQEDVIGLKDEFPELNVLQGELGRAPWQIYFSLRPGSPFLDERVRQAISMSIDRELILDTFSNVDRFRDAGWPIEAKWHNVAVAAGYEGFWLNPQADMGDSQKYFEFNPTEARRLLEAAGHRGLSARFNYIATPQYGSVFPNVGEAFIGLLNADGNFNLTQGNPDYQTEYLPAYYFAKGDFDGIAWGACTTYPHVGQHLLEYYHSQGGRQKIAFMNDPSSVEGTAASDDVISKMMQSLDFEEQVSLIQQWQRENASRMPIVPSPWPGGIGGFGATWPWAMNLGSFRDYLESPEQATLIHWWLDPATTPRT